MTAPTTAEPTSALVIRPDRIADGTPVVWVGPVLTATNTDPDNDPVIWVAGPYGFDRLTSYLLCDARTGTDPEDGSEFCDAEPVACIGEDLEPVCVDHLPQGLTVPGIDAIRWRQITWTDVTAAVEQITTATLAAYAICETTGHNVPDLLAAGLRQAAELTGGSTGLVRHRPGSWEAEHVAALAAGLDDW
jgi:hypothetical protein